MPEGVQLVVRHADPVLQIHGPSAWNRWFPRRRKGDTWAGGRNRQRQRIHDARPLSTQLGVGASLAVPRIAVARTLAVARRTHHGPTSDLRIADSGDMRGDEF